MTVSWDDGSRTGRKQFQEIVLKSYLQERGEQTLAYPERAGNCIHNSDP